MVAPGWGCLWSWTGAALGRLTTQHPPSWLSVPGKEQEAGCAGSSPASPLMVGHAVGRSGSPPGMALLNPELEKADGNLDLLQTT